MRSSVRLLTATALVPAAALAAVAAVQPLAAASPSRSASPSAEADTRSGLAAVRAATARYHRTDAAIADGYLPGHECAASPDGVMGQHWVHPGRIGSTDPGTPAVLLYAPDGDGRVRLVGVEYFVVDADQDLSTDDDRPSLLGRPFDGPMPGHEPGMPVHYDLHVWVWAHNPAGTFAPWNPALSC